MTFAGFTHAHREDRAESLVWGRRYATESRRVMMRDSSHRLANRVALVTGGGGVNSIGRSICLRFGDEGAKVGVLDIDGSAAERVAGEIQARGGSAMALQCDVTDLARCEQAARQLADSLGGRIDILVNNAALMKGVVRKAFTEWSTDEWDRMLNVNLRGQWFCIRAVFPYMKAQSYGKIINLTSSTFWEGVGGFIPYTSSKAGIIGLTRALGRELGEFGIRVNAIAPGYTVTDSNAEVMASHPELGDIVRVQQSLTERNEAADDLAGPAFFLASEDSDFMTCQTILVDGGRSMW
jgi:3-oxoacyl-[acyl-carrier protein] reductase